METSRQEGEEKQKQQRSDTRFYVYHSPCYFCGKVIEAILKCLGHDSTTIPEQANHAPPYLEEDTGVETSTRSRRSVLRRPPPLVSSGKGGKIH